MADDDAPERSHAVPDSPFAVSPKPQPFPRRTKIALWSLVTLLLFILFGFFALPPILKSVATKKLTELLHRETSIREIHVNPFAMTVQILGGTIKEREGTDRFVSFDELFLNIEAMSLIRLGPVVSEVRLKDPFVSIIRNDDLTYNFSDLLDEFAKPPASLAPEPPKGKTTPLRFSINNIQLLNGGIDFRDRPKRTDHAVRDLTIVIPFLSNLPASVSIFTQPEFRATVNGTPVALQGKTKPFHESLSTEMALNVRDFDIPKYLEYLPGRLTFKLPFALLDTTLTVAFTQFKDRSPVLTVSGGLQIKKLTVTELDDRPVLDLPLLDVSLEQIDVFGKNAGVKSVLAKDLAVSIRRGQNGALNVASLGMTSTPASDAPRPAADRPPTNEQPAKPPATPQDAKAETNKEPSFTVAVGELTLANARITFTDETTTPPFGATIHPLNLTVSHFTNASGKPTGLDLSLTTDARETITHRGEIVVEPMSATGIVVVAGIPLKRYAPYYGGPLLFTVEEGSLGISVRYSFAKTAAGTETKLSDLAAVLKSLRLRKKGEKADFLTLPELTIKGGTVDVNGHRVGVGELASHQAGLLVHRAKDGTINLTKLVASPEPTTSPPASTAPVSTAEDTKGSAPPWQIDLSKLTLDRYAITIDDQAPSEAVPIRVEPIFLSIENFSTARNNRAAATVKLTVNKTGALAAQGSVGIAPLGANLGLDLKGLDLVPLQPYFTDKILLTVTSGALSAKGLVTLATTKSNETAVTFVGDTALTKFATVDKANSEEFLKFGALAVTGIQAASLPFSLDVKDVSLSDFSARLLVNPEGSLNVKHLLAAQAEPAPAQPVEPAKAKDGETGTEGAQPAPSPIKIGTVTLQGGTVAFTDRSVRPNYSASLTQIAATVSGLTSEAGQPADLEFHAKLDDLAPFDLTGKINPLAKDLFVDTKLDLKGMELSPLTPYAGKYAGYTAQKGQLSLDLKYLIDHSKLDSTNKVLISQFTFGDSVDSPDATTLPVKLAVSLLKDRHGDISLDLPVTGSLDDPKFSVWGVILDIIKNLLVKAATSPFALLGSLVGGGEELSHLEFDAGTATLGAGAEERLKKISTLLTERPALQLEIAGRVDPEPDKQGLTRVLFERKVKAQKLADLVKRGESAMSVDDITVEPAEFPTYLRQAYKKEDIPGRPTNFFGFLKDVPDAEMERLMLSAITVGDDELRQLAQRRAQTVKDYFLTVGKLPPERLFLVEGGAAPSDKKPAGKASRVDFIIK